MVKGSPVRVGEEGGRYPRKTQSRVSQWQRALSFYPEEEQAVTIGEKLENGLPDQSENGLIELEDL